MITYTEKEVWEIKAKAFEDGQKSTAKVAVGALVGLFVFVIIGLFCFI